MPVTEAEAPPTPAAHLSFFRQSGWLMIANIAGGMMMWAVHFLAKSKYVSEAEYGDFGTFLAVVMVLPTMPLQMILAQQTAKALASNQTAELSGVIRMSWLGTSLIWLVGAVLVLVFQNAILARWHMSSPIGLWVTLPIILLSVWLPLLMGMMQGPQNFLWLGWSMLANALGRIVVAAAAILVLHAGAPGMMAGVLLGIGIAVGIGFWQTRALWLARAEAFDWRSLLTQALPLTLGFLGFQILFTADTMFVKAYFPEAQAGFYVSAGTLSRALMWLVLPLAAVMFPRLVHSAARAEKSNLMGLVLAGTAALAIAGAVCLSNVGPFVVRLVYKESYVQVATSLLPWYAGAMVPLALANVLLSNLLAKPASKLLPAACMLASALVYLFALTRFHDTLIQVLQTMGACNMLLLAVCAFFTWRGRDSQPAA
jgi:O-antigen/teichoic acid export membrane protein